ncbi:ATP/GTP-binding protein [Streptomyces sp. NPDC058284]|uniref:GTP-binding protein n=1 Tax=unclassified Streptomyces TaxID=2593676 RepID=UPI00365330B5
MACATDSDTAPTDPGPIPRYELKVVVTGGFGAGKTTTIASVSEIDILTTEAGLTTAGAGVDDLNGLSNKTTTTVAMDFGRITFPEQDIILYLFGTPGQERFQFMWDELGRGAVGAVVLADTRRLRDSFVAINWCEHLRLPFVVAVNRFDDALPYEPDEIRQALDLDAHVPLMVFDARERSSAWKVLYALVEHSLQQHSIRQHSHPSASGATG